MYLGEDDLGDDWRMKLEAIGGVTTRDLSKMVNDSGWELKGWASKAFALLMSSFREVIYLDADALFFVNPETLFDDPGYTDTGALFFRDRVLNAGGDRKEWLKSILPKPISRRAQESRYWTGDGSEQQESGAMAIDTWRHMMALLTITRMNGPDRGDDPVTGAKGVYSMFYGDKETFWLGFELAGDTDYSFHTGPCGNMGTVSQTTTLHYPKIPVLSQEQAEKDQAQAKQDNRTHFLYTVRSPQLLHLDRNGRPLWWNGWILDDKYLDDKSSKVSKLDVYMSEVQETGEPTDWVVHAHNMATLRSDQAHAFSEGERGVLDMIVQVARDNGVLGKDQ